jgi:hypothetical protein
VRGNENKTVPTARCSTTTRSNLNPFDAPQSQKQLRAGPIDLVLVRAERAQSDCSCPPLALLVQHRLGRPAHSDGQFIFFLSLAVSSRSSSLRSASRAVSGCNDRRVARIPHPDGGFAKTPVECSPSSSTDAHRAGHSHPPHCHGGELTRAANVHVSGEESCNRI